MSSFSPAQSRAGVKYVYISFLFLDHGGDNGSGSGLGGKGEGEGEGDWALAWEVAVNLEEKTKSGIVG